MKIKEFQKQVSHPSNRDDVVTINVELARLLLCKSAINIKRINSSIFHYGGKL